MAPVSESGTAIAAAGGALWAPAAATCASGGPLPPAALLLGIEDVAAELGGDGLLAPALGGESIPFGSGRGGGAAAAAAGSEAESEFESVAPLDLDLVVPVVVPVDDDDEDGCDADIGAWSGRG